MSIFKVFSSDCSSDTNKCNSLSAKSDKYGKYERISHLNNFIFSCVSFTESPVAVE